MNTFPEQIFLSLLGASVGGEVPSPPECGAEEWEAVFHLAEQHQVLPMIVDAAFRCAPEGIPADLLDKYKSRSRKLVMTQAVKTDRFLSLYSHLTDRGLQPMVVKGIVCRSLYPKPDFRLSADEDLLIEPEEAGVYHRALLDFGMRLQKNAADPLEDPETGYLSSDGVLFIEVHRFLFSPGSRAYGEFNRFFRGAGARKERLELGGAAVYAPESTDHLFYLIAHAFKHFLHGGFGIRQICDVGLFTRVYGSRIDRERLRDQCDESGLLPFAAALLGVAERHLGLSLPQELLPPASAADCEALLGDVLDSGVFGSSTPSRKHSSSITLGAVESAKEGASPAKGSLGRVLFPSAASLSGRYTYLNKYPCLLPAAWVHRFLSYARKQGSKTDSAAEAMRIGAERSALLRRFGLLDAPPKKTVDTGEYISSLLELVAQGEEVGLPVAGSSMTPFLGDGRDQVFIRKPHRPPERGDVVLYRRDNGDYVLHRIHRVHGTGDGAVYDVAGDAQSRIERGIRRDQIFALVTRIRRKGRILGPESLHWRFFQKVWIGTVPLRSPILRLYGTCRRYISKKQKKSYRRTQNEK